MTELFCAVHRLPLCMLRTFMYIYVTYSYLGSLHYRRHSLAHVELVSKSYPAVQAVQVVTSLSQVSQLVSMQAGMSRTKAY